MGIQPYPLSRFRQVYRYLLVTACNEPGHMGYASVRRCRAGFAAGRPGRRRSGHGHGSLRQTGLRRLLLVLDMIGSPLARLLPGLASAAKDPLRGIASTSVLRLRPSMSAALLPSRRGSPLPLALVHPPSQLLSADTGDVLPGLRLYPKIIRHLNRCPELEPAPPRSLCSPPRRRCWWWKSPRCGCLRPTSG